MPTAITSQKYSQAAQDKFTALEALFRDGSDSYWRLANAFDTMIDFLTTINASEAPTLNKIVEDRYNDSLNAPPPRGLGGYDNAWFDDFGWWTIASQRAVSGNLFPPGFFQDVQQQCWTRFTGNAPYVWERRAPGSYASCRPAYEGGLWNEYWKGTSSQYPGPKGADPTSGSLEGIQNTVSNALYLIAAQRVGDLSAADREFAFFSQWFGDSQQSLWWQEMPDAALVRERAGHFYGDSSQAPGFQRSWAWTGDQGLILGALTDRMRLKPADRPDLLKRATLLLTGVRRFLIDGGGLLLPWTSTGDVPDGDATDYATGPGVFWRYALHAFRTDSDLRAILSTRYFQDFLKVNADAAAQSSGERSLDELTNDVAVLVAAANMVP